MQISKRVHMDLPHWPTESCWFESDFCVSCASFIATILMIESTTFFATWKCHISLMWLHLYWQFRELRQRPLQIHWWNRKGLRKWCFIMWQSWEFKFRNFFFSPLLINENLREECLVLLLVIQFTVFLIDFKLTWLFSHPHNSPWTFLSVKHFIRAFPIGHKNS